MPPNYYQQSQLHQYQHLFNNAVPVASSNPIIGMTITTTSPPNPDVITMETRTNGKRKDSRMYQSDKNSNNHHYHSHHPPPPPTRPYTRNPQCSYRQNHDDSSTSRSSCTGSNKEIMSLTMMDNNNDNNMNMDDFSCCMNSSDVNEEDENSYDGCDYDDVDDDNVDDHGHDTDLYRTNSHYTTMNAAYHKDSYPSWNIQQQQYRRHSNHHHNKKRQQHSSFMTARILACSSPEITSLLKQSQQQRYNIKSNDSKNAVAQSSATTTTTSVTFPPPTDNMVSGYQQQQLLLPSLSTTPSLTCALQSSTSSTGSNKCYHQHRFDDPMDVPSATMTTTSTTSAIGNTPVWTESWLSLSKAQYQQEETNHTTNTSSEIFVSPPEPCSYNSSDSSRNSYGMKVTEGTSFTSSSTVGTTPTTIAATTTTKSMPAKLSLHRRISNDQLPQIEHLQLNDASLTSSATSCYSYDTDNYHYYNHHHHPPNNSTRNNYNTNSSGVEKSHRHDVDTNYNKMTTALPSSLNKLLLQKSVTIVSDDTNNCSNNSDGGNT